MCKEINESKISTESKQKIMKQKWEKKSRYEEHSIRKSENEKYSR